MTMLMKRIIIAKESTVIPLKLVGFFCWGGGGGTHFINCLGRKFFG